MKCTDKVEVINTKITSLVAFGGSSNYTNGSLVWSAVGKTFALTIEIEKPRLLRKPRNPSGEPCANEPGSEFSAPFFRTVTDAT
jgi:hypothetical protein